jgi:hypothetical protein
MIILMIEAVSTTETSINFYDTTQRNIPEDMIFTNAASFFETWVNIYLQIQTALPTLTVVDIQCVGGSVHPRAGMDTAVNKIIPALTGNRSFAHQTFVVHFTDRVIPSRTCYIL